MKVLFVAPHFPPRHIGGVESYTKRLADYLAARGDRPWVVCIDRIDSDEPGLTVNRDTNYRYPVDRLRLNFARATDPFVASYHSADVECWAQELIVQAAPDVIHLHSGYLVGGAILAAARRHQVPAIVTLHDFWFICPRITLMHPNGRLCTGPDSPAKCAWCLATERRRYRLPDDMTRGNLGRLIVSAIQHSSVASLCGWSSSIESLKARTTDLVGGLMQADLVLAPSHFLRDLMTAAGIPANRVVISRYGIDTGAVRPRVGGRDRQLRIGYLGQLAAHKGVHIFVDAIRRLSAKAIVARVYGDPAPHPHYVEELHRMAGTDSRITFCGPYRHETVYDILSELDVVVVPSVWYENSPFVIQEAHAAHVPVVASRLGGMRELVTDGTDGVLFEPGDARDLARQLQRLLDDVSLLERLTPDGSSVRTESDEFETLLAHYQRLANRNGAAELTESPRQRT
jgi:glycosyltransferase involved in cell wall biosynthesis